MRIIDFLFPPKCVACRTTIDAHEAARGYGNSVFCTACRAEWERAKRERCEKCHRPMIECDCCPFLLHDADGCIKLCKYGSDRRAVQSRMIFALKRRAIGYAERFVAAQLAPLVSERIGLGENIVITYIPRKRRIKARYGYDQARLLAKNISDITGIPLEECLVRKGGREQKGLSAEERLKNAKRSFRAADVDLGGMSVILVDDIITTGSSMRVAIDILRSLGAEKVYCMAVAKTQRRSYENGRNTDV